MKYSGNIVDVVAEEIFPGTIIIKDGRVAAVNREERPYRHYLIPGFVDAHIHIESSMLPPSEFARVAVCHGTVATVSDPHEIANVLGLEGIEYMLENAATVPLKFHFSAPSCVPATGFETAGAAIGSRDIEYLFRAGKVRYLGEMMNYPGVIFGDEDVHKKLAIARKNGVPIDGHCPGLTGADLEKYIATGIATDHECTTVGEALEKRALGMKILIREGSAARNLGTLMPFALEYPEDCMFCSDDRHPDDLLRGHINGLVVRVVQAGMDPIIALRVASYNPVKHYGLEVGLLQPGDPADLLVVENLHSFRVLTTVINGRIAAEEGSATFTPPPSPVPNKFTCSPRVPEDFAIPARRGQVRIIEVSDGQLLTGQAATTPTVRRAFLVSDPSRDLLKLTVVNRYADAPPALGLVRNFGLKSGALASSVAHDSHNIVAVGVSDEDLAAAVNLVISQRGGLAVVSSEDHISEVLPLPVAGLMSNLPFETTAQRYTDLTTLAKNLGCPLQAPFMTLSFMALLVIPELKLSDRGLFDGSTFSFLDLFTETPVDPGKGPAA